MANCCINNITFYSTEKAKIERLYNDFLVVWNKEDETGQTLSSEYLIIKSMGYDYNGKVVIDGRDCVTYLDEEFNLKIISKASVIYPLFVYLLSIA